MNGNEAMFREDAENLARQIQEEDPMVEVVDIKLDPSVGGYVITVYDHSTEEEYTINHFGTWERIKSEIREADIPSLMVEKVREKRGKKTAFMRGNWTALREKDIPDFLSADLARGDIPGDPITIIEPSLADFDFIYPGHGSPHEYSVTGNFLIWKRGDAAKIWRRIIRLANFTQEDQSDLVKDWLELGFKISPEPLAPAVEEISQMSEEEILEEVKDRLFDLSERGFEAILVDGPASFTAYTWLLAGKMGLKVITAWKKKETKKTAGYSMLCYSELLNFRTVEESLEK